MVNEKIMNLDTSKRAYKTYMHKAHTQKMMQIAKEEYGITGKLARKIARNLIKKKLWDERESRKKSNFTWY
jgi:flavorubredoxin